MKRKIFTALTVVFALCLALTVYALNNQTKVSPKAISKADCCAKKDSCPMKDKQQSAEKTSCCDKDDCCCKGDSCPMKMNGEKSSEGKSCCCMGGDSCPMKKTEEKQTADVDMTNVTVVSGESCCKPGADCCKGGACCKDKHS